MAPREGPGEGLPGRVDGARRSVAVAVAERTTATPVPLDDVDRRIVTALRADGRLSTRRLAEHLGISRAGAYARLDRLERTGVIRGYTAVVDPHRLGQVLTAYVYLKIAQSSWKSVRERVLAITEVEHAALLSGEDDIVLLVRTGDATALRDLVLERLQADPEVLSTRTVVVFDEVSVRPRPTSP